MAQDLCAVGSGRKFHIKSPASGITWCGYYWDIDAFEKGLIGVTEKCDDLCKLCLKEYKRAKS